jgi:hypothetical protein
MLNVVMLSVVLLSVMPLCNNMLIVTMPSYELINIKLSFNIFRCVC